MILGIQTLKIVQKANELVDALGTREPHRIAHALGIEIIPVAFRRQRGAYRVLLRNRFIFIKNDLDPVLENIVLLHEIGHDVLHREEAMRAGSFDELDNRFQKELLINHIFSKLLHPQSVILHEITLN